MSRRISNFFEDSVILFLGSRLWMSDGQHAILAPVRCAFVVILGGQSGQRIGEFLNELISSRGGRKADRSSDRKRR